MSSIKKIYIAAALDFNDLSGVPEMIGRFDTREEAEARILEDMRDYCDNYTFVSEDNETVGPLVYDEENFYIENFDGSARCKWSITETSSSERG